MKLINTINNSSDDHSVIVRCLVDGQPSDGDMWAYKIREGQYHLSILKYSRTYERLRGEIQMKVLIIFR